MAARRDDRLAALLGDDVAEPVGVIGTIGNDLFAAKALDQLASGRHVVLLTRSEFEADRQRQRVYDGMQFGAEAAARAAESLGFRSPFLRRAPAA